MIAVTHLIFTTLLFLFNAQVFLAETLQFDGGTASYTLTITVEENVSGGSAADTMSLVVNINDIDDEPPVCNNDFFTIIEPDGQAGEHIVVNFGCTDADAVSTLAYTITSGDTTVFFVDSGVLKIAVRLIHNEDLILWKHCLHLSALM